ncbi:MerR family transcriptional regulator [Alteromonas sp. C1M14]|uniref:MerR family transcriptional regulator n=1 Tax=Alteromonas sp. C1M14 TaxID=2841567 RepID=UPI001C0A4AC1|nr:MerR family transcriptional regulator [Alteromonas sp. C1M14]MBU2976883.1 MerR family transcriptional regulator [Alteromonas sp. C1M14]
MKIQEAAKQSGVKPKNIRYYEDIGLLPAASRDANGYREYSKTDIERLVFVRRCRDLQIPIKELKALLNTQVNAQSSCGEIDHIIMNQLQRVQRRLKELTKLEETLSELAHSCRKDQVAHCEILQKLRADAKTEGLTVK